MGRWGNFLLASSSRIRTCTEEPERLGATPFSAWRHSPARQHDHKATDYLELKKKPKQPNKNLSSLPVELRTAYLKIFQPEKSSTKSSGTPQPSRAAIRCGEGRRVLQAPAGPSPRLPPGQQHQPCRVEAAGTALHGHPDEQACYRHTEQPEPFGQCKIISS